MTLAAIPALIWIALTVAGTVFDFLSDGEPGPQYDFRRSILNTVTCNALLYAGGFFEVLFK